LLEPHSGGVPQRIFPCGGSLTFEQSRRMNMAEKNSDFRDASIDASMPLVAKALAHLLANASPDVIKRIFGGKTILGVPSEIATALGGGGAGLAIAKAIEHFHPGMDPKTKDRVMDLAPMVAAEYNRIIKDQNGVKTTAATGEGAKAMESIPDVWVNPNDPTIVYIDRCPKKHHLEEVQSGKRKNRDGADADLTKFAPKNGFIPVEFEAAVASGAKAPLVPEPGCACKKLFAQDRAAFDKQQAEKAEANAKADKAKAEAAKPRKPFFRPETTVQLERAADGVMKEVSDVFREIDHGFRGIGHGIKAAAKGGEKIVRSLPDKGKALDARVTAGAASFAASQGRLLKIERFARSKGIKNVRAFREWIIEQGIEDLDAILDQTIFDRFGRRERS